jgi:hypothetical protein
VDINRAWESIRKNMKNQPQRIQVIINLNRKNNGLTKSAQKYYIKGSKLNCNGCRIQAKQMEIILNNVRRETRRAFRSKKGNI